MVDEATLVKMYQDGAAIRQICCDLRCSVVKVYHVLAKHNIARTRQLNDNRDRVLAAYAICPNMTKIATDLGLSVGTVFKYLHRNGVEIHDNVQRGAGHHNWKGGVTPEVDRLRKTEKYKLWRRLVYARDMWKCRVCGCKHTIHAHHIVPMADDKTLYDTLDNGITLCVVCHGKTFGCEQDFVERFKKLIAGATIDPELYALLTKLPDPPQPCACGCGQMTKVIHGHANRFVRGHVKRGKGMADTTKAKLREAGAFFKRSTVSDASIEELYGQGKSCAQVAMILGCSNGYVINRVKVMGISRSRSEAQKNRFGKTM